MTQLRDVITNRMFQNRHSVIRDDAQHFSYGGCTIIHVVFVVSGQNYIYVPHVGYSRDIVLSCSRFQTN